MNTLLVYPLIALQPPAALLPYKEEILNTLLVTIRHAKDDCARCSAISVLTDIVKEIHYSIYSHHQEVSLPILLLSSSLPPSLPPSLPTFTHFLSLNHSLPYLLTHSLTNSLPHLLIHSLTHSLTNSLTHSLSHSLTTHLLTHSLLHSLTHSLTLTFSLSLLTRSFTH